jgi:hypothetical protein
MAWIWLSIALALYFTGSSIDIISWLLDRDPFPGPSDLFCLAFYPAAFIAALYLIRAAAVRVPWVQLSIDATICVVGFGAFFWFLVIRPAQSGTEVDFLKQMLSQVYAWLDCLLLLMFGVLLLAEASWAGGRRIAMLLWLGFSTLFLADILWSTAKVGGVHLPGGLRDVLYLCCYVPLAAAGREQIRASDSPCARRSTPFGWLRAIAALRGDAHRISRAGVLEPRRYRRPGDGDDHYRIRAHTAVDGAPGHQHAC